MMAGAETIDVTSLRLAGPYPTVKPFMTDSLDAEGKRIDLDELYMETTPLQLPRGGENILFNSGLFPSGKRGKGFPTSNHLYQTGERNASSM